MFVHFRREEPRGPERGIPAICGPPFLAASPWQHRLEQRPSHRHTDTTVPTRRREQVEAFLAGETPTWARAQLANIKTGQAKQHARDERADLTAARARLLEHLTGPQLAALLARGRTLPTPIDVSRLAIV